MRKSRLAKETLKAVVIYFFAILCLVPVINADPGAVGSEFLNLGIGARATSMGESFTGLADDVSAGYWNAGGIAQIDNVEILASYDILYEGINHMYFGFGKRLPGGITIGGNVNYLGSGSMYEFDSVGNLQGNVSMNDICIALSAAKKIAEKYCVGINIKMINEKLADVDGSGYAADLGILYKCLDNFSIGLAVQNMGSAIEFQEKTMPLPMQTRLGASYTAMKTNKGKIVFCTDISREASDNSVNKSLGGEYMYNNIFALRLGMLSTSDGVVPSYGLGLVLGQNISLDFGVLNYSGFGAMYKISMLERFGTAGQISVQKKKLEQAAEIETDRTLKEVSAQGDNIKESRINEVKILENEMEKASKEEDYVKAARYRKMIQLELEIGVLLGHGNYIGVVDLKNQIEREKKEIEAEKTQEVK